MKIYTKTGDKGETGLFGGERVSKDSPRIRAYGTIDELNAFIGLAITEVQDDSVKSLLSDIQNKLFIIGSDLATPDNEKTKILNVRLLSFINCLKPVLINMRTSWNHLKILFFQADRNQLLFCTFAEQLQDGQKESL